MHKTSTHPYWLIASLLSLILALSSCLVTSPTKNPRIVTSGSLSERSPGNQSVLLVSPQIDGSNIMQLVAPAFRDLGYTVYRDGLVSYAGIGPLQQVATSDTVFTTLPRTAQLQRLYRPDSTDLIAVIRGKRARPHQLDMVSIEVVDARTGQLLLSTQLTSNRLVAGIQRRALLPLVKRELQRR